MLGNLSVTCTGKTAKIFVSQSANQDTHYRTSEWPFEEIIIIEKNNIIRLQRGLFFAVDMKHVTEMMVDAVPSPNIFLLPFDPLTTCTVPADNTQSGVSSTWLITFPRRFDILSFAIMN